jgi:hypothetical protein
LKSLEHPLFGLLVWADEQDEWWTGRSVSFGRSVELAIWPPDASSLEVTDEVCKAWVRLLESEAVLRRTAIETAREWYVEMFGHSVELNTQISIEDIVLNWLQLYPDGSIQLGYGDGDLFGGHIILLYLTPSGEIRSTELAG